MKYLIIFIGISLIHISHSSDDVIIAQSEIASTDTSSEASVTLSPSSTTTEKVLITSEKLDDVTPTTAQTPAITADTQPESSSSAPSPSSEPPKRKTVFINQQQNGKMNVQLELSDVSVIVIPNQKENPQLSLLNLLFKSAQKRQNEERKKEENALKSTSSSGSHIGDYHHDQYSKVHSMRPSADENYTHDLKSEPFIESRAPYRVDISSTLVQSTHPTIEISPNSQPRMLKKRSIDSRLLGIIAGAPTAETTSWMETDENEIGGEEPIANILRGSEEDEDLIHRHESEFSLLGAVENCGPGRRRNSYQICVAIDYEDGSYDM